jgi:hypothetical protein
MNRTIIFSIVLSLLLGLITPLNALNTTIFDNKDTINKNDPDCDGRLWLWGPYGGWTGDTIYFTPSINSLNREDAWNIGECCVDFLWEFGDGETLSFNCCTMQEYSEKKPNRVSHTYENSGTYTITLTVTSPFLELYDTDKVIIKDTNPNTPNTPSVSYSKVFNVEEYVHQYLIVADDLDNDPVRFYFEFEDGYVPSHPDPTQRGWTKFYESGETANIWDGTDQTNGVCRIKAQDVCGAESEWVEVKSRHINRLKIINFVERLPLMEKLFSIFL